MVVSNEVFDKISKQNVILFKSKINLHSAIFESNNYLRIEPILKNVTLLLNIFEKNI